MIKFTLLALTLLLLACEGGTPAGTPQPGSLPASGTPTNARTPLSSVTLPASLTAAFVTRVVDGDTIDVQIDGAEYRVRYIGIDTPETVDPRRPVGCLGPEASAFNRQLVEGKTVGLEKDVSETDQFGRLLRYVWLPGEATATGQPEMVNATLVTQGYAQAATYPPDVKHQELFLSLQTEARESARGLWGIACATPTTVPAPTGGGAGECEFSGTSEPVIKGNISRNTGERIYHVPGQQYYDETVVNEAAGERWFCTEAEAVAAGWRRAKV